MNNNGKIGVALVGGYLLGRTKKAKMALGLGLYLAGKKLNLNPQQLAKMVANSPVVGQLSDQVRKDLIGNTKSALTSAVTQRAGSLADSLHERTLDMNDPTRRARGSDDAEDEGADDETGDRDGARAEDDGEDGEREERRERPKARKAPAGTGKAAKTAKSTRSAASGSSGGRSASGGAGSNGARKTASSGARKTTGGARKTAAKSASGGARKAANRGGGNG